MKPVTRTTCPYCGVGCGVLASPDGTIKGDPDHPANGGRLCSKGTQLGETIGDEGRLLHPLIGGMRASWDDALDLVARNFTQAIRDHGPDSVAFYVSGQLLTEDYYVANKLMKGFIGSANIDSNSRLCMASSVAGHKRAFGSDTVPGAYADFEQADLVVLVGSNLAWCHPVLYQRLAAAKKARPGMKVVNVDPRRTATSDLADMHLSVRPDGDVALFNAVLTRLARENRIDQEYVAAHVTGLREALASAAAEGGDTGLDKAELDAFTALWAQTEKVVTIYSQGVNQSACGTDKVNAIINCHLATGRIGRPGMGPFSVTGQPNAMGGREVGALANMLASHLELDDPSHRAALKAAWNSPAMCAKPGLKAVDLFRACESGQIKALWIMSTNPAVSLPDADRVARAIGSVPFTVASDAIRFTDTNELVDVLLPAAPWGEKSGTVTNSERCISRQRAFLPVRGEARPDWRIVSDVAARMGWAEAFDYDSPADVFREYAALSELGQRFGRDFDITALETLSDKAYDTMTPQRWPLPRMGRARERFFADGGFFHADRRARMVPTSAPVLNAPDCGDVVLNTGRIRDQWHTMTRTGLSPRLGQHLGEPFAEMHPEDAARIGVTHAELVRVETPTGDAVLRAKIDARARPGSVFVPMHWTRQNAAAGRAGPLVHSLCDPVSGQPALKSAIATVEPFAAAWYGFVASAAPIPTHSAYCAVRRTETGWCAELAGDSAPEDWPALFRALAGGRGKAVSVSDTRTGYNRFALYDGPVLKAVLLTAPHPVEAARASMVAAIGTETRATEALAGRLPKDRPDAGATLCSCMNVGINTVRAAIAAGAVTVDAIGEQTGAGTNCGSCKPELQALIAQAERKVAAE